MIVYHGSDSNFKQLRIAKDLVKRISTADNEGMGIYFSTDKMVARSYGKYIYTLEVNDDCFLDFRKESVCKSYVNKIIQEVYQKCGVNLYYYFDSNHLCNRMYWGGQSIYMVGKEISDVLDSTDKFYCSFTETKRREVYRVLRSYDKRLKAYMFNYHIKDIGVLKSVDDNVVKIINKESSY